mgnify:CR=1 FL=1
MVTKEIKWTVYRHISPSGNVYIGITSQSNIHKRWKYGTGYNSCICFERVIKKYGWKNIRHEILFTGLTEEKAKYLEIELIRHYKGLGISYNLANGGQGWLGLHHSEESKRKMRLAKLGKKQPSEVVEKRAAAMRGKPCPARGVPKTLEQRKQMSQQRKGKKTNYHISKEELSKRFKEAQKGVTSISVYQYNIDGTFVTKYDSMSDAARAIGGKPYHISECCNGKLKTSKGYIWRKVI